MGPEFTNYIAITSPSAWAVAGPLLPHPPRALEFQGGMGEDYLKPLIQRLPDAEVVLAIGGGNALDVGKVAAWKLGKPLIMIPTIVSTGAIFQAPIAIRRPQTIWQFHFDTIAPEYLLLDFDVIAAAPPHLNRAGMGECICILGHVGSWHWWADNRPDAVPLGSGRGRCDPYLGPPPLPGVCRRLGRRRPAQRRRSPHCQ